MLRDFCRKYVPINNPQSEVETRMDGFLTGVRNASNMGSAEKLPSSGPSPGAEPASGSLPLPQAYPHHPPSITSTPTTPHPILLCHSNLLSTPIPLLHRPPYSRANSTIHPSSATSPCSPLVCQCGKEQTRATTIYTSCVGWWC